MKENGIENIYPVNAISFHRDYNTFATGVGMSSYSLHDILPSLPPFICRAVTAMSISGTVTTRRGSVSSTGLYPEVTICIYLPGQVSH